jgi:hypothetical protein
MVLFVGVVSRSGGAEGARMRMWGLEVGGLGVIWAGFGVIGLTLILRGGVGSAGIEGPGRF